MNHRSHLPAAATIALAVGLFSSCSAEVSIGNKSINTEKLERNITSFLDSNASTDSVSLVTCPTGEKGKEGDSFVCAYESVAGEKGDVVVTVTDEEGGVSYRVDPTSITVSGSSVESSIDEDFLSKYPAESISAVSCPEDVATGDETTECALSLDDGTEITVTVTGSGPGTYTLAYRDAA